MILINDYDFNFEVDHLIPKNSIQNYKKLNNFLTIAKNLSLESNFDKYKLGAVIILKNKIISKGYNKPKSHPLQKYYNNQFKEYVHQNSTHGIHAELEAINKLKYSNYDLKKAEIIIYRLGSDGEPSMARPCAGCMEAIKLAGIPVVHYTTPEGIATEYILNKDLKVKNSKRKI